MPLLSRIQFRKPNARHAVELLPQCRDGEQHRALLIDFCSLTVASTASDRLRPSALVRVLSISVPTADFETVKPCDPAKPGITEN